jgi:small subunit ribosomal protein S6
MMKYELMVIVKPFLPEDVRVTLLDGLKKEIVSKKGKVAKEDIWGKRHLAYTIKGHEEGYYVIFEIEVDPKHIDAISKEYHMMNDVLRFMFEKI